jgi:competence protein ComEA
MSQWLEQNKTPVIILVLLSIAAGVALLGISWRPVEPISIEPPLPTSTPGPIRVYVSGAVIHPEVYTLPPNTIIRDALLAAGGTTGEADLNLINLAQPLQDGQQIYVPRTGETVLQPPRATSSSTSSNSVPGGIVNINTGTLADLDTLPGIGPAIAQRIIDYREANGPFTTIEGIMDVSGIGPATFDKIKDLITVN